MKRMLIAICLMACAGPAFAADNIVVLFDTSGSMNERMKGSKVSKIKAAQDALCGVVDNLPPTTNMGIITFQGWIANLGPVNKEQIKAAINATRADGGTPLGKYTKDAADALIVARKEAKGIGTYKLLIVTDGEASDSNLLAQNIPHVKARGIIIQTIGVDMASDHALSKNSKTYMTANDNESLKKAITTSVAEVGNGGDGVDEENFRIIAPLDSKLCGHIITALTSPSDTLVGEQVPVYTVKEDGTLDNVSGNPTNIAANNGGGFPWGWVCGGAIGVVFLLFVFGVLTNRR